MALGSGRFRYEPVKGWAKIPRWWDLGEVAAVAVNSEGLVYAFTRSAHPVVVFDKDGNFVSSWGEGQIRHAHGIHIGPDDSVYLVDREPHVVLRYSPEGKLLHTYGNRDKPGITFYRQPFNMPTAVALAPSGELFVADGYGNYCVHRLTPDGKLLKTWGEPGKGPGQFALVHHVALDRHGRVYICDRENYRVQIFDGEGKFLGQWADLRMPCNLYIGPDDVVYMSELGRVAPARVSIWSLEGKLLSSWDTSEYSMSSPHGIWVDSGGDIYMSEVLEKNRIHKFVRVA